MQQEMSKTGHKSRWGYHPCDYQTYLKAKLAKKYYWTCVYAYHRALRWWAKDEHNQHGSESKVPKFSMFDKRSWKIEGKPMLDDCGLLKIFDDIRMPKSDPVDEIHYTTLQFIELVYKEAVEYFDK